MFWQWLLYAIVPWVIVAVLPRWSASRWLVLLVIWIPIEFGWVPSGIGRVPVAILIGTINLLWFFWLLFPARVSLLRMRSKLDWEGRLAWWILGYIGNLLVTMPLGLMVLGFLHYHPISLSLGAFAGLAVYLLLMAFAEELLFRGVIQTELERLLPGRFRALALASVIFGLSHLNNAAGGFSAPNWAYFYLSTLAGFSYGVVFRKSGHILDSTLLHFAVNLTWKLVLT